MLNEKYISINARSERFVEIINRDINRICSDLNFDFEEKIDQASLYEIDFVEFISSYFRDLRECKKSEYDVKLFVGLNRTLFYGEENPIIDHSNLDNKRLYVFNKELLSIAFDNIIENIEKHSFTDYNGEKIIYIDYIHILEDSFILAIYNTGRPFPDEFTEDDYFAKGKTHGEYAGSGNGGYIISKVLNKFNWGFQISPWLTHNGVSDEEVRSILIEN